MRPGPTIASNVFSLADIDRRLPVSSVEIVPKAPLMSPTGAESSAALVLAAPWRCAIKLGLVVVVMTATPFTRDDAGSGGTRSFARTDLRSARLLALAF